MMQDILEIALRARSLDVAASPYDATEFGAGIVPVETSKGRRTYREEQAKLMHEAEPVRRRLLGAYDAFMKLAFDEDLLLSEGDSSSSKEGTSRSDEGANPRTADGPYVAPERLARAEPGGLPWRKSLIEK